MTRIPGRAGKLLPLASWLGATLLLVLLVRRVHVANLWNIIEQVDLKWLAVALACNLLIVPCMAQQWRMLLSRARVVPMKRMMRLAALMQFFGNTVPASGQVSMVVMLSREPGINRESALSALALDQLVEGLAKLGVLVLVGQLMTVPRWMFGATQVLAVVMGAILVALLVATFRQSWLRELGRRNTGHSAGERAISFFVRWSHELESLRGFERFAFAFLSTCGAKLSEILGIVAVQHAFGNVMSAPTAVLVLAAGFLGSIVPVTPANIGTYEGTVSAAYVHAGVSPDTALAMAIVQHACLLLSTAGVGYLVILAGVSTRMSAEDT